MNSKLKIIEISNKLSNETITELQAEAQLISLLEAKGSCFWGHKWSSWQTNKRDVVKIYQGKQFTTVETYQIRECLKCGKKEFDILNS